MVITPLSGPYIKETKMAGTSENCTSSQLGKNGKLNLPK
jgi:hypothetical protein